jgi:hypothetical protein
MKSTPRSIAEGRVKFSRKIIAVAAARNVIDRPYPMLKK